MRYYFRADGNAATGAGHLMRCLTIADALQALPGPDPADICFLCADEASGALAEAGGWLLDTYTRPPDRRRESIPA